MFLKIGVLIKKKLYCACVEYVKEKKKQQQKN